MDWTDPAQVSRALRAMARIMDEFDEQYTESLRKSLRRDGCQIDAPRGGYSGAPTAPTR